MITVFLYACSATPALEPPVPTVPTGLDSPDPAVRSAAALAFYEAGDPRALDACLRTLDDLPDALHEDRTPAVRCLVGLGEPSFPGLLERLAAPDELTRLHAQRAIEGITRRRFGFDGKAWPAGCEAEWLAWWAGIGYAHDGTPEARAAAIGRLRAG